MQENKFYSPVDIGVFSICYFKGGRFEKPGRYGTYHLMEHLMCKKFEHLYPKLSSLDIDWNAYTSENSVQFVFSGLNECIDLVRDELLSCITESKNLWTEEQFLNEQKIVIQEYMDSFNDPNSGAYQNLLRKHYNHFGAIGLADDILSFTYNDSLDVEKEFNNPDSILSLNNDSKNELFDPFFYVGAPKADIPLFKLNYKNKLEKIPKGNKKLVGLISKNPTNLSYIVNFASEILTSGIHTPLFQEVREKRGLSYFVSAFSSRYGEWRMPVILASTDKQNVKELKNVFYEFFDQDISNHITKDLFNEFQSSYLIKLKKIKALPHSMFSYGVPQSSSLEKIINLSYDDLIDYSKVIFNVNNFHTFTE